MAFAAVLMLWAGSKLQAQQLRESTISEHVRIRLPAEREWLARDAIADLERCWRFMNGATGDNLPRKVLLVLRWDDVRTSAERAEGRITIGMNHPAAAVDSRAFLLHNAAREMARLGLLELSKGVADTETTGFLFEGMSEILVHEYEQRSRSLDGAWVIAHFLNKMQALELRGGPSSADPSRGMHGLTTAAPAITFVLTCREIVGRERTMKVFEALRKGGIQESLTSAFKMAPAALESAWMKKVQGYNVQDITVTSEDDAPRLTAIVLPTDPVRPGAILKVRLTVDDRINDLPADCIFVQDVSGRVVRGTPLPDKGGRTSIADVPIEAGRKPGAYDLRITAVDGAGNVRNWQVGYRVD